MKVLFLCSNFELAILSSTARNARVAVFACRTHVQDIGTASIPTQGTLDADFLGEMLAQTREARLKHFTPLKLDTTDLRLDRVYFRNGQRSIELLAGKAESR